MYWSAFNLLLPLLHLSISLWQALHRLALQPGMHKPSVSQACTTLGQPVLKPPSYTEFDSCTIYLDGLVRLQCYTFPEKPWFSYSLRSIYIADTCRHEAMNFVPKFTTFMAQSPRVTGHKSPLQQQKNSTCKSQAFYKLTIFKHIYRLAMIST